MKIQKILIQFGLALGCVILIAGCSPSPSDAEKALSQQIDSESGGQIKLVSFKKIDGQKFEVNGIQGYNMDYEAEIEFEADGIWLGRDIMNHSHSGLTFSFRLGQSSGNSFDQLANNMAGGIAVRRTGHAKIAGVMMGEKKESGWKFETGDSHVTSQIETLASSALVQAVQPTTTSRAMSTPPPVPPAPLLSSQTWTSGKIKPEAWNFTIVKKVQLDSDMTVPVFSRDGNEIAYAKGNSLIIKSLTEVKPDVSQDLGGGIQSFGWSPDDKRILCVMADQTIKILDIQDGKQITLPVKYNDSAIDRVFWESETNVYFIFTFGGYYGGLFRTDFLNLDTLKFYEVSNTQNATGADAEINQMVAKKLDKVDKYGNPGIGLKNDVERNSTSEFDGIFAYSTTKNYSKLLIPMDSNDDFHETRYVWPQNVKCIIKTGKTWNGERYSTIFITGISTPSATEFHIEKFNESDNESGKSLLETLSKGIELSADVFKPEINPLNGKIIGSMGKYKGSARIYLKSGEIHASTLFELEPFVSDDVVGNLKTLQFRTDVSNEYDTSIWGALEMESESQAAMGSSASANPSETNPAVVPTKLQEILTKAQAGDVQAQLNAGVAYSRDKNYDEAFKWNRKAAEQGNAMAQTRVGIAYESGRGVAQDYAEAINWYRKAAEQNNSFGQCRLGTMYYFGWGVDKNVAEAVKWFQKSADQGNHDAQIALYRIKSTQ